MISIITDIELGFGLGEMTEEDIQMVEFGNGNQEDYSLIDLELGFGREQVFLSENVGDEDFKDAQQDEEEEDDDNNKDGDKDDNF